MSIVFHRYIQENNEPNINKLNCTIHTIQICVCFSRETATVYDKFFQSSTISIACSDTSSENPSDSSIIFNTPN